MMAVSMLFPNAKKDRIEGRECDIVFFYQDKCIGIQYDGCYYHKNAETDEAFNSIFLNNPQSYLIRIREKGCPELKTYERAFYLSTPTNYSIKKLQELFNSLFERINSITGCDFHPQMTKQLWQKARQEFNTYNPKQLAEEYIAYSDTHENPQHQQEHPLLREQVESALQKQQFSGEILEHLYAVQQQKKLLVRTERDPQSILCSLKNFLQQNGRLPRQQKGDAAEHRLYLEMKRCLTNNRFSEKQLVELQQLRKQSANTRMTSQELFEEYVQFVQENHRLPNASGSAAEKSLDCKVAHRLFRNTFTREQVEEICKLRQKFSLKNRKNRIIAEYQQFVQNNLRLPDHSAPGTEGALERSMQHYLRKGVFSAEECNMIAEMRAVYQTLSKQLRDQVQYFKKAPEVFIESKYVQFVEKKGRLPCMRGDKEERELCRMVLRYLDTENFPITKI